MLSVVMFAALVPSALASLAGTPARKFNGSVAETPVIRVNHAQCLSGHEGDDACIVNKSLYLRPGETFNILITQTDTSRFTYAIAGVKVTPVTPLTTNATTSTRDRRTDVFGLYAQYETQFGGYLVTVKRKPAPIPAAVPDSDLGNMSVWVTVNAKQWQVGFGSGFTISGLTDPAFGIRVDTLPHKDGTPLVKDTILISESNRRDQANKGLAAFVHVWYSGGDKRENAALTFGLGVDQGHGASYYFGPSYRFGDRAALTAGVGFGTVKTEPSGTRVNEPIHDLNVLNQLGQRTAISWFVGLSYAFIGGSADALKKPFATETTGVNAGSTGSGGAAPPATTVTTNLTGPQTVKAGDSVTIAITSAAGDVLAVTVTPPDAITLDNTSVTADANGKATVTATVKATGRVQIQGKTAATTVNFIVKS